MEDILNRDTYVDTVPIERAMENVIPVETPFNAIAMSVVEIPLYAFNGSDHDNWRLLDEFFVREVPIRNQWSTRTAHRTA